MRLRLPVAAGVALLLAAVLPAGAAATFHLVSVREVFPGDASSPAAEYVELQAYAPGQNMIAGHSVAFYDASGSLIGSQAFAADAASSQNQSTFLLATPAAEARFALSADQEMPANLLEPGGGAVCWASLDCVAWGSFAGGSLPSPTGPPALPAGIPDGMALRRTLAPGCATLLEASDDHDSSALDFSPVFPAPRPNATTPSEHPCGPSGPGPGPGGGGPADSTSPGPPNTILSSRPPKRTHDRTPTFRFHSDEPGSSFQCRLDSGRFRSCASPFTARRLALGAHRFAVRARDRSDLADPSPAALGFVVIARR